MHCDHEAALLLPILVAEKVVKDGVTVWQMLKFKCVGCGAILKVNPDGIFLDVLLLGESIEP